MNVADKVILITGAAQGIGEGIARVLGAARAKLVLADLQEERAREVSDSIREDGGDAIAVRCDVSSRSSNEEAVARAVKQYGRLDAIVTSAIASHRGPFLDVTEEDIQFTLSTSLVGTFYSCQAAARRMVEQGAGGSVLIISSVHVVRHYPNASIYNMAKAGVASLARTLASELASKGIRVNTIIPGWTDTPGELAFSSREDIQKGGEGIPLGRIGQPRDIGNAALYLLSEEASYVTGCDLLVDGGFTLHGT